MQFKNRSYQKEFLDNNDISTKDLYRTLVELDIINTYLGGYKATLDGFKSILKSKSKINKLLDIGFGGGDSIKQLSLFAYKNNR